VDDHLGCNECSCTALERNYDEEMIPENLDVLLTLIKVIFPCCLSSLEGLDIASEQFLLHQNRVMELRHVLGKCLFQIVWF
jgi:hypothetical protein